MWTVCLLIPVLFLAVYQWYTISLYGYGLFSSTVEYVKKVHNEYIITKWFVQHITGMIFMGGCSMVVLFYFQFLSKRLKMFCCVAFILSGAFIFSSSLFGTYLKDGIFIRASFSMQAGLMITAGFITLWLMIADVWKNRNAESILLLLWISGTFVFTSYLNWTINARSLLPMIPAACILLFRRIEKIEFRSAALPMVCAGLLTLLVCSGDYLLAKSQKTAALEILKKYQDKKTWFQGHWGFQYYIEQKGALALNLRAGYPHIGDIIITAANNTNITALPPSAVDLKEVIFLLQSKSIATMDDTLGAGFYSNTFGNLPFAVGPVSQEPYLVHLMIKQI